MKKLILLLCLFYSAVSAQKKPVKAFTKPVVAKPSPKLEIQSFKKYYELVGILDEKNCTISNIETQSLLYVRPFSIAVNLKDSLNTFSKSKENAMIESNEQLIDNYLRNIVSFGENGDKLVPNKNGFPFSFVNIDNKIGFIQHNIYYRYELNSFKLDQNQRFKKIAMDLLLPSLKNFKPLLSNSNIEFYVLDVAYNVRDFVNQTRGGKPENLTIQVLKSELSKYLNAEISDKELIQKSSFYNFQDYNMRKVDVE